MLDRSGSHIREQGVSSCVVIYCVYACMHAFVVYVFVYVHACTLCVYFLVAILTHSCVIFEQELLRIYAGRLQHGGS